MSYISVNDRTAQAYRDAIADRARIAREEQELAESMDRARGWVRRYAFEIATGSALGLALVWGLSYFGIV